MLANFNEILDLDAFDNRAIYTARWVEETYRKNKSHLQSHNNQNAHHDFTGYLGEIAFYTWLRDSCTNPAISGEMIKWSGWELTPYGDKWDVLCPVPKNVSEKGFLKFDVKSHLTDFGVKSLIYSNNEVWVNEGQNGATQIYKDIDVFIFCNITEQFDRQIGTYYVPYLLGYYSRERYINDARFVFDGKPMFLSTEDRPSTAKAKGNVYMMQVKNLWPCHNLPRLCGLTASP